MGLSISRSIIQNQGVVCGTEPNGVLHHLFFHPAKVPVGGLCQKLMQLCSSSREPVSVREALESLVAPRGSGSKVCRLRIYARRHGDGQVALSWTSGAGSKRDRFAEEHGPNSIWTFDHFSIMAMAIVPTTVKAMKGGASDFLTKPFVDRDCGCHPEGHARTGATRQERTEMRDLRGRYESLTPRNAK